MRTERLTASGLVKIIEPRERITSIDDLRVGDIVMLNNEADDCMPYLVVENGGSKYVLSIGVDKDVSFASEVKEDFLEVYECYRATLDTTVRVSSLEYTLAGLTFLVALVVLLLSKNNIVITLGLIVVGIMLLIKSNMWSVK